MKQCAMVGGGSWATALTKVLTENGFRVQWWLRNAEGVRLLREQHHNPHYLSSIRFLPSHIQPTTDLSEVVSNNDVVYLAVPSAYVGTVLQSLPSDCFRQRLFVSAVKGMIPGKHMLVSEFLEHQFGVSPAHIATIAGPSHAEEVAMEKRTCLTIAAQQEQVAQRIQAMLTCAYVQCTISDDVTGTEYSAVLKNIYAIAAGIYMGLGYGDNFHAVLVSNSIEEMERFLSHVHPIRRDIKDSAYLGDLLVTAYSAFSRNRTLGVMIGKGYSVHNALLSMQMVAEGYFASACIHQINQRYQVPMPIAHATYRVLYERADARQVFDDLSRLLY